MRSRIHLVLAFAVGACAGSSGPLVAEPAPEPAPTEPEAAQEAPAKAARAGTHVTLAEAERRIAPHGKASIAMLARGEEAFVGQLELEPLVEIPAHRDPTEETIVVLEGGGTLLMDGRAYQVGVGSVVYMPANAEVSFANGPNKLVALQVFADPDPASKYDDWKLAGDSSD